MRLGVTLLGITTNPSLFINLINICAGDLLYFSAKFLIIPISSKLGSSDFPQGLSGDPRGL